MVLKFKDLQGRALVLDHCTMSATGHDALNGATAGSSNPRALSHILLQGMLLGSLALRQYGRPFPRKEVPVFTLLPPLIAHLDLVNEALTATKLSAPETIGADKDVCQCSLSCGWTLGAKRRPSRASRWH